MTNSFNISPFIKTAFVALAFIAGSIPSASHADDFLASMSTGGLESQLILDANPQDLKTLELLERGVCPQDPKPDPDPDLVELIRSTQAEIDALESKKKTEIAKIAIDKARLEGEIRKLDAEIARLVRMKLYVEAAVARGLRDGKQAELNRLELPVKDIQVEIDRKKWLIGWLERCKKNPKAKP